MALNIGRMARLVPIAFLLNSLVYKYASLSEFSSTQDTTADLIMAAINQVQPL